MKKKALLIPLLAAAALLAGCAASSGGAGAVSETEIPVALPAADTVAAIDLDAPEALPEGVTRDGSELTVTAQGTYRVTGTLSGRLTVDADGPVELVLAGAELTGPTCLDVVSGDPVTVTTEAGTVNTLSDGVSEADGNADAVLLSKAPLTLGGEGWLSVVAGAHNGIQSKDDLTVTGGHITVLAANHGLKAKGSLTVAGGTLDITSGADGLTAVDARLTDGRVTVAGGDIAVRAAGRGVDAEGLVSLAGGTLTVEAENDAVRGGSILVSGGDLALTAGCDGLQAAEELTISGGTVSIVTAGGGGGAINKAGDSFGPMMWSAQATELENSAKGLKSDGSITVTGGDIDLSTADDAVHAATLCSVAGGTLRINAGDDAIHSDDMLVINDGSITITDCFEGLEAFAIEVHGGDISIRAVNDGINCNGPEMMFPRPGASGESETAAEPTSLSGQATTYFRQTGGVIDLVVTGNSNNVGDGVDSNGYVFIDGGVLTVSTKGDTMEGGIDTGRDGPTVTGGMVMAGGASMMQEDWTSDSTQCCAVIYTDYQAAGTVVTIWDEDGREIWSVTMENTFNCLVLSHPELLPGHVYTVTYGSGSSTLDFTETTVITMRSSGGWGFGGRR